MIPTNTRTPCFAYASEFLSLSPCNQPKACLINQASVPIPLSVPWLWADVESYADRVRAVCCALSLLEPV